MDSSENKNGPFPGVALENSGNSSTPAFAPPPANAGSAFADAFLTYISDKNPLYLISAALILYAQTIIFRTDSLEINTAIPVIIMAFYCSLLAGAAALIVRLGKVWDDARSIFLILAVLFMVMSVAADGLIINNPGNGKLWLGACFVISAGLSELICSSLKITVPLTARVFFYAMLGLFYVWPVVLSDLVRSGGGSPLPAIRGILLFPAAAGVILLILTPLFRRPAAAATGDEKPWLANSFPMALFAVFGAGVICRSYLFSLSFHGGKGVGPYSSLESGFGMYVLAPFLFCLSILLLERALRVRSRPLLAAALFFPLLIPVSGLMVPNNGASVQFLQALPAGVKPLHAAVFLGLAFYAYAWLRRLPGAAVIFCLMLFGAAAGKISIPIINHAPPADLERVSALAVVLFITAVAFLRRSSILFTGAGALGLICLTALKWGPDFTANSGFIPAGLMCLVFFLGGILFRDRFSAVLNYLGAWSVTIFWGVFCADLIWSFLKFPGPFYVLCPLSLLLMTVTGRAVVGGPYKNALRAVFVLSAGLGLIKLRGCFIRLNFRGAEPVFWGLMTFACAFLVSLRKGGVLARLKLPSTGIKQE